VGVPTVACRGWPRKVADTCRSEFAIQVLVQLVGNKLGYLLHTIQSVHCK
jgi:hypothetical protein